MDARGVQRCLLRTLEVDESALDVGSEQLDPHPVTDVTMASNRSPLLFTRARLHP
jgi:hypothetical protein